ncbi:MAG TPA: hypothetical protein VL156_15420 [Terriglobales bacterium]|jgi:hypothetical protein|nr:hypothetical protein [Terriglobales bacterium]
MHRGERAVRRKTDTIEIGSKAPDLILSAANSQGKFSLPNLVGRGPLVIEFLRGTW